MMTTMLYKGDNQGG